MARILIIDDEESVGVALKQLFEYEGHRVHLSPNGPSGLIDYPDFRPDVVFLDVKMPKMDGLEVLERIREADSAAVVVMVSGHGTIGTAVEATRKGAFDFLEKPLDTNRLLVTLRNALMVRGLSDSVERLTSEIEIHHGIVGASSAIRQILRDIEKVGATDAPVLITGENGTGKELTAKALHRRSARAEQRFVEVNCAAIPSELIESELFGHVKGSFTGAVADREGKFEQAHRGTLFLDEVGDMSLAAQAKVLRALQGGDITPVGGARPASVDVRVIAATNKDLYDQIEKGDFREDLLHRLNMVTIRVPPLRERREDIPMLVAHFADLVPGSYGVTYKRFTEGALGALVDSDWPGNVRQLKNAVARLMILSGGDSVERTDVDALVRPGDSETGVPGDMMALETLSEFKEAAEKAFIAGKLRDHDWNVSEAARRMGMPRSNLYKKIERHGLQRG
ncbi:MAG: sigma-54-dependent Fis family transcriptional regulator [Gemmatimonadetes bacterium]|nr:sigma-54 dependent transcriptional regulator [Gemmatimonadota bacterium]MYA41698.1 sigma-54-dependent Fis family transcriptional regulator [Gemmatimonadota bacterium]MYE94948.1 sigma-54-dependent Fis family transcriptional regulator [Gemmatimonadota bacterium]MYJ12005.1 sigma-54-dependent Fis family transcriptional regulator [Gemmatimonadota bacterium]